MNSLPFEFVSLYFLELLSFSTLLFFVFFSSSIQMVWLECVFCTCFMGRYGIYLAPVILNCIRFFMHNTQRLPGNITIFTYKKSSVERKKWHRFCNRHQTNFYANHLPIYSADASLFHGYCNQCSYIKVRIFLSRNPSSIGLCCCCCLLAVCGFYHCKQECKVWFSVYEKSHRNLETTKTQPSLEQT